MKLEQFIIQDGAGYECLYEFRAPVKGEYFLGLRSTKPLMLCESSGCVNRKVIYKLTAPPFVENTFKYCHSGKFKFAGKFKVPTDGDYFYHEKKIFLHGGDIKAGPMANNWVDEAPIYTKVLYDTSFIPNVSKFEKHPVEKTNEYFDKASEVLDEVYDALKGISAFVDNLKKEYSAPPPFIKQGEDYFLYVKHDVVQIRRIRKF